MSDTSNLNDGPVARALMSVSAPMALGILGVLSVGLVDAFFLARDGEASLAAVGFIFPVTATLTSLSIGLTAGTNTVISQAIGKGEDSTARDRLAAHAMGLSLVLSCLGATLFYLAAPMLFQLMGAKGATLQAIMGYVLFWCLSFPFLVTGMALNAVFRAGGRSGVAATVMVIQSLLNIGLDPLLIFGAGPVPAMGTAGAGAATCLARMLAFSGITLFALRSGALRLDSSVWQGIAPSVRRILRVGAPAALSNAINPAGMAVVTAAVATLGDAAVAGFGAAGRIQAVLLVPMLALSSGIGPVVGQAWGAGRKDRARDAMSLCFWLCLAIGLGVAVLMALFAGPLAGFVTDGTGAQKYAATYLRVASWGFFAYGVLITANAAMNARDRALWSMGLSGLRIAVLYVPLTWLGVMVAGYSGLLIGIIMANVLGAWAALIAVRSTGLSRINLAPVRAPAVWLGASRA